MNIQAVTPYVQQNTYPMSFQGKLQKLFKPIEGLKVCKGMTEADRRNLHSYINCKPYMMGITTKEIDELSKFDGKEFVTKTTDFIMNRFKIPEEIKPSIIFDEMPSSGLMGYSASSHILIVDMEKIKDLPKNAIFGLIRHELTHLQQNMSILRHETVGVKAVDEYAKTAAPIYRKLLLESFEHDANMDIDKAIALKIITPEKRYILDNAMKLYEKYDFEGYESYVEKEIEKIQKEGFTDLRNKIIETCGGVIPDWCAKEQLEAGLKEFIKNSYTDCKTMEIDLNKYFSNMLENEALIAQQAAEFEFSKSGCFIKYQKGILQNNLSNPAMRKFIESTIPD